jgi:predicted Ser/Thr protein kinase
MPGESVSSEARSRTSESSALKIPPKKAGAPLRVISHSAPGALIRLGISVPDRSAQPPQKSVRMKQTKPVASRIGAGKIVMRPRPPSARPVRQPAARKRVKVAPVGRPATAAPPSSAAGSASRPERGGRFLTPRYRLLRLLGEGGSGTVYKAQDTFLNAVMAVKILNKDLTFDRAAVQSLKAEALTAMRLSHPHIVHLNNLDKAGVRYFLVMEYIEGNTLRGLLDLYGYLKIDTVARILTVCSDALSYAHRVGVLHNDLKPANLLITEDGVVKLIDFGISCLINTQQKDFIMGTPAYMSPEQIRGEKLDQRTDIYSLGIMTYEMLVGKTPFPKDAQFQDVLDMLPLSLKAIANEDMRRVLQRAVAPAADDRYSSVAAMTTAFIEAAYPAQSGADGISV